jgi:hypothetical protein
MIGQFSKRLSGFLVGLLLLTGGFRGEVVGHAQQTTPRAPDTTSAPSSSAQIVVDDFESYQTGRFPSDWVYVSSDKEILSPEEVREPGESITVRSEDGNQFLHVRVENEAIRYSQVNDRDFDWTLDEHPRIRWRWRAHHLPEGASERGQNDTGAALYVTFGSDWLGRPKSIKYTYSSSLPVGTVVSFGPLKVIVVDSKREPGLGEWKTVQRDLRSDYRQVFGDAPPNRPVSITFWSDSDTTGDYAEVDFDDITLLPPHR